MDYRTSAWGLWSLFRFAVGSPWASSQELLSEAKRKGWITDADAPGERIDALEAALGALTAAEPVAAQDLTHYCVYCEGVSRRPSDTAVAHAPDCPWVTAKALLRERS